MNWEDPAEDHWHDGFGDPDEELSLRWPLSWRGLYPRERWIWFDQIWSEVCMLRDRYRLAIRSGWWENEVQLEALAALGAWVARYDCGEWDDPPGKLTLLYDLERVGTLLRDGIDPFNPDRDRGAFLRYLIENGCQPPLMDEPPRPSPPGVSRQNGHDPSSSRETDNPNPDR